MERKRRKCVCCIRSAWLIKLKCFACCCCVCVFVCGKKINFWTYQKSKECGARQEERGRGKRHWGKVTFRAVECTHHAYIQTYECRTRQLRGERDGGGKDTPTWLPFYCWAVELLLLLQAGRLHCKFAAEHATCIWQSAQCAAEAGAEAVGARGCCKPQTLPILTEPTFFPLTEYPCNAMRVFLIK